MLRRAVLLASSTLPPSMRAALGGRAPAARAAAVRPSTAAVLAPVAPAARHAAARIGNTLHTGALRRAMKPAAAVAEPAAAAVNDVESLLANYEAVIGIETHLQLSTATKAFCGCALTRGGAPPNTAVCPVCLGHPGTLPVVNRQVLVKAVVAGLALGCDIDPVVRFDRKQYFYPDLPKGYQISQHEHPLCANGQLTVPVPSEGGTITVTIQRAHVEEDAGKLVHAGAAQLTGGDAALVDYNRAGVPLLEVVSGPDMRTGAQAAAYAAELRRVLTYARVSDAIMQDGGMRCDVNVSVRPKGESRLGTKVEIKNMNSFSAMQRAIDWEVARQAAALAAGRPGDIVQETRLFDEASGETAPMRVKEGLADYRYFAEPDLLPGALPADVVADAQAALAAVTLPADLRARLTAAGLPAADVAVLTDDLDIGTYFAAVLDAGAPAKPAANWVMGDITAAVKGGAGGGTFGGLPLTPAAVADLVALIEDGTLSGKLGKQLLPDLLAGAAADHPRGVRGLVDDRGLAQISDPAAIAAMVDGVLASFPDQLAEFRAGKTKLQGFFVGELMKVSKGRANPGLLNKTLNDKLKGGG